MNEFDYDVFSSNDESDTKSNKEKVVKVSVSKREDDARSYESGYQDEGGSNTKQTGTEKAKKVAVATAGTAAVVSAALKNSNKVPKSLKKVFNNQDDNMNHADQPSDDSSKEKVPFFKKWWFWLIVALLVLMVLVGSCNDGTNTSNNNSDVASTVAETKTSQETTTETTTMTATAVAKVYSVPSGAKVENINGKWGLYKDGELVEGYTGIASNNLGDWYIENGLVDFNKNGIVKDGTKEYQVNGGKAVEYSNGTTVAPKLSESEYKSKCQKISYTDLARNPDNYKGQYVRFYGQVLQVQNQSLLGVDLGSVVLRVATKDSGYGNYYDDVVYVTYSKKEGEGNILEDDFVTLYGTYAGTESYTTVLGAQVTIPKVEAEYIDIA